MKNSVTKSTPKVIKRTVAPVTQQSKSWNLKQSPKIIPPSMRFDKKFQRIAMIKTTKPIKDILPIVRRAINDTCAELNPAGCYEFVIGHSKGFIGVVPVTEEKTMLSFYVARHAMSAPNKRLKAAFELFEKMSHHSGLSSNGLEYVMKPNSDQPYTVKDFGFMMPEPDEIPDDETIPTSDYGLF